MKYGRYGWSYFFLRWGLGLTFLLIALDMWRHPDVWIGYLPQESLFGMTREALLFGTALFNAVVGALMMLRVAMKVVASLAALHVLGVLVFNGLDPVLLRDVGLLGAALALATWPTRYRRRKHGWGLPFMGKKKSSRNEE